MASQNIRGHLMDDWHAAYWVGHIASPIALFATLIGIFPAVTAVVVFVFYCLQIYESKQVQRWLKTRRRRKIAQYNKRIHELEAQLTAQEHDKD